MASAFLCTSALAEEAKGDAPQASAEKKSADSAATDNKRPGSGPNPYADCGIGAALFTETKWAAVTSNVIWDLGITAITSATASPQTCSGKQLAAATFIHQTYPKLVEETAVGGGEHLSAVLQIMDCDASRHGKAILQIRADMAQEVKGAAYTGQSRTDRAAGMYSIIDRAVSAHCSV